MKCKTLTIEFKYYNVDPVYFKKEEYEWIMKGHIDNCIVVDNKPAYMCKIDENTSMLGYSYYQTVKEEDLFASYQECEDTLVARYRKKIHNPGLSNERQNQDPE